MTQTPTAAASLPPIDRQAAQQFWDEYRRAHAARGADRTGRGGGSRVDLPADCTADFFGDSPALADALLRQVTHGAKRATATLRVEFEEWGEPEPVAGTHWIACDGAGRPAVVLRTTEVRYASFDEVDEAFAYDEGEDDRTLASWRREHERYWRRTRGAAGQEWDPALTCQPGHEIVLERFVVAWPPTYADDVDSSS